MWGLWLLPRASLLGRFVAVRTEVDLKRFDQALACDKGADRFVAGKHAVTLTLNQEGRNAPRWPRPARFVQKQADRQSARAQVVFKKMAAVERVEGRQIIAQQRWGAQRDLFRGVRGLS